MGKRKIIFLGSFAVIKCFKLVNRFFQIWAEIRRPTDSAQVHFKRISAIYEGLGGGLFLRHSTTIGSRFKRLDHFLSEQKQLFEFEFFDSRIWPVQYLCCQIRGWLSVAEKYAQYCWIFILLMGHLSGWRIIQLETEASTSHTQLPSSTP